MRRTLGQIRAILVEGAAVPAAQMVSRRVRAGVYLGRLGIRILRQWARDRCPQQAAALAFQSTLSLVPVLAIAATALRSAGVLDGESRLVEFIGRYVLPDLPDVAQQLQSFSAKVSTGAAGVGGLAFTFLACFTLYSTVGRVFNDIWRVRARRSLVYRLLVFYALITVLPVLAGVYLYWSGKLVGSGWGARLLGPLAIQFLALFLTNKLLPNTFVTWRAAAVGTLVSGVLLEGLKWAFVLFAKRILLESYATVYGPLGLVPLVLVWIYVSWLIVLLGAEIANAMQNLRRLEADDRRQRGDEPLNGVAAAQLLTRIAADFEQGGRGVSREALARDFGLSPETVERIGDRLKARGLVAEVQGDKQGYIPARPPAAIPLAEVLATFRATDLELADGAVAPALAALVRDLDEARRTRLENLTVADLVASRASEGEVLSLPARGDVG